MSKSSAYISEPNVQEGKYGVIASMVDDTQAKAAIRNFISTLNLVAVTIINPSFPKRVHKAYKNPEGRCLTIMHIRDYVYWDWFTVPRHWIITKIESRTH